MVGVGGGGVNGSFTIPQFSKQQLSCNAHELSCNFFCCVRGEALAQSRTQLYFSQRIAATGITLNTVVYHRSNNFSCNFTAVLTRVLTHTFRFAFQGALRDKLLGVGKMRGVTGPSGFCRANVSKTSGTAE